MMQYRRLGNSTLMASEIGFGCMSLSGAEPANITLLQEAFQRGINLFDTADLYQGGANEVLVGKAFRENRQEIILCTKVGNQLRPDGGWDWNPRKEYILSAVDKSLQRLGTDYIDLYQLHGGMLEDPIDETIEAFELLVQQGKIRYYGISSIRPTVIREYLKRSQIVTVMTQYSLLDRRPEESSLEAIAGRLVSVLARGVVAQGVLVNKPAADYLGRSAEEIERRLSQFRILVPAAADRLRLAIQWVLSKPVIGSAILGIRTSEQLQSALDAATGPALDKRLAEQLAQIFPATTYAQHR